MKGMQLTSRQVFASDPATVIEMLCNPDFLEQLCQRTAALSHSVDVSGRTSTLTLQLPTPDAAAKFIGATLNAVETVTWGETQADGSIPGTLTVTVAGFPVKLDGTASATPDGDSTVIQYDANLVVSVPFVGAQIEKMAAPQIMEALEAQQEIGNEWLAAHPR